MEIIPAGFSKFISKGKPNIPPIGIIGGDVGMGGFETLEDYFDVVDP